MGLSDYQPSLFDNVALNIGKKQLEKLEFSEARIQLKTASEETCGKDREIVMFLEASDFWEGKVGVFDGFSTKNSAPSGYHQHVVEFLDHFVEYTFFSTMGSFKKSLLKNVAGAQTKLKSEVSSIKRTCDLLLGLEMYQEAQDLMTFSAPQYPENTPLLYYLAQTQCLNGNRDEARGNYARAILNGPDEDFRDRIVDDEFLNAIRLHGLVSAPAYGMLRFRSFSVAISPGIKPVNDAHENGIQAYKLMQKLKFSQDMNAQIAYRKKLKELSPDLFRAYMGQKD